MSTSNFASAQVSFFVFLSNRKIDDFMNGELRGCVNTVNTKQVIKYNQAKLSENY